MYPVLQIEDNAPDLPEQLGTKQKFWLHIAEQVYLFKIGRPGIGENWAEKVAAELVTIPKQAALFDEGVRTPPRRS